MTVCWALAGGKPQALRIISRLAELGRPPVRLYAAGGLPETDHQALAACASRHGIVLAKGRPMPDDLADLDLLVTCRYGLLTPDLFEVPRLGAVNVHASLLPAYRGIHPVSWALVHGESETGVTVHRIDAGVDTGDILIQKSLAIDPAEDLWGLTDRLDSLSAEAMAEMFVYLEDVGRLPPGRPQTGPASWARRRRPEDGRVNWTASARAIHDLCRALPAPLPPAWTRTADGRKVHLIDSRVPDGRRHRGTAGMVVGVDRAGWAEIVAGDGGMVVVRTDPRVMAGDRLG